ncbi:alpha/beta hydrolase fold [Prosthecochloris aestuarii DSM 271]|uniref:Alpha/beta hydrolase fold n=1 Tax=Prosthecochloris aestuarii (strain DSM 271 / SK 413) TaxID=290512 RepID=B4S8U2_PROA2|nr:alpha/beta hydrolase [Prosthecochloris aestuarii]ACF46479.1 alpha/beta hydrolase fold [Prosthecochloris aestuarii DSM 271]
MTPQSATITLSGHKHRYIDTGGSNHPLLLLHGISCSLDIYEQVVPLLTGSFRVLAIDLLGFGMSDKPKCAPYSLKLYASLIREFLEQTDAVGCHAVGHSMGGKYALATALLYPGSFSRLVVSNTDGFTELPGWVRGISWPGIRQVLKKLMSSQKVASKAFASAFHAPERVNRSSFKKNLLMSRNRESIDTVMQLNRNYKQLDMAQTGLRSRLWELDIPILILWGDHDQYISPKVAAIAHRELPGSELFMFENCGHAPMLEYPRQFSEVVAGFLLNH